MAKELTWRNAIQKVLAGSGTAMHYKDIADEIVAAGLRKNVGATPAATVSAQVTTSIKREGDKSPFVKVGKGEYVLRTKDMISEAVSTTDEEQEDKTEQQYEIVTSFGMFWRRELVYWSANLRLLGMQQIGAEAVDFGKQIGIYLLYDGREVIYVGRSSERPIGRRLYEHTMDRLSSRWDKFSWFGLLPVSEKGVLGPMPQDYKATKLIPAIEAILIEALEPRQNRKRGDDLTAVEFLQKEDPEISKQKFKESFESALDKM